MGRQVPNSLYGLGCRLKQSAPKILTKRKGQAYEDYLAVVKGNPEALLIKLADLDDNKDPARLAALPEVVAQRLRTKYERAAMFLAA